MQKHTSQHGGWKYTVTALALSVAMAPMAQAASVLKSTGKLEITGTPTSRTSRTTSMAEAAKRHLSRGGTTSLPSLNLIEVNRFAPCLGKVLSFVYRVPGR